MNKIMCIIISAFFIHIATPNTKTFALSQPCLTLCAIIKQPPSFKMINYEKILVLYLGKYSKKLPKLSMFNHLLIYMVVCYMQINALFLFHSQTEICSIKLLLNHITQSTVRLYTIRTTQG